jgi:general stress protein YciG
MTAKRPRGFAAMDPEERRAIARLEGLAAHEKGTAHEFTREEARHAGKLGGWVVSRDRNHLARIRRKGGAARARRKRDAEEGKGKK